MITRTHPPTPPRIGKTAKAAFAARRRDLAGLCTIICDAPATPRPCTAKFTVSGVRTPDQARAQAHAQGWSFTPTAPGRGRDYCPNHAPAPS